jgi:uncharacterized membrane protein YkoI
VQLVRPSLYAGLAACAAVCLVATSGSADGIERAREGVREGRYVPLEQIVDWVGQHYHGRLLEVEFEDDDEGEPPTYEVEWLTPAGHVIEFEFDARNGALLEVEGRGIEEARRE